MGDRTATGLALPGISGSKRVLRLTTGLCGIVGLALMPGILAAQTLPTGSQVVSGQVTVAQPNATQMTITQGSDRAIVNWNSFSIGHTGQVVVQQPGANSALLNRVTGNTTSEIHGRLTANGQVHLVNPNGIFIGPSGRIQGQGFVASTLDISDADFQTGRLRFSGTGASGQVTNQGDIALRSGGFAALLGGRVSNEGTVTVPLGRIGLAAGERVTLDLTGDQFLQVALPSADDGDDSALIQNAGTASAAGGMIEMKAATARQAVRNAINLSGVAEARSVSKRGGTVYLGGGPGGAVKVTGRIDTGAPRATIVARSARPVPRPMRGGDITVTGAQIALQGATLDASGPGGGGTVRIGGDFAGQGPMPRAQITQADATTRIRVDGLDGGSGGRIVLWSDLSTDVSAQLSARGGDTGGDGGFVEISGAADLRYRGLTDLRAPVGAWGHLWLDPYNITVAASGGGLADPTVDVGTLTTALSLGDVTLDTATQTIGSEVGNIAINADIVWTAETALNLRANADIDVDAQITADQGSLEAVADGEIRVAAPIATQSGSVRLTADSVLVTAPIAVNAGELLVTTAQSLEAQAQLSTTSGSVNLTLGGSSSLDRVSTDGGRVTAFVEGDLALNGGIATNGGSFYLEAVGDITPTSAASVDAGEFRLVGGNWDQAGGTIAPFAVTSFWRNGTASFLRAASGDGSTGNPYVITDVFGLQGIDSPSVTGASFRLGNTINARGTAGWYYPTLDASGFSALGSTTPFSGALDGDGHAVEGLVSDTLEGISDLPNGLFRAIGPGGRVSDLAVTGISLEGAGGGLFAVTNQGVIERVSISGSALYSGDGQTVGGFVGTNAGTIRDSRADVALTVNGSATAGGFVGANAAGGLIEAAGVQGSVTYTDTSGTSGRRVLGGFVGTNAGDIADSVSGADVTATIGGGSGASELVIGGFAGSNQGAIDTSLTYGAIAVAPGCCTNVTQGAFNAEDLSSGGIAASNYWDATFGLTQISDSAGGTPLPRATLQDTELFYAIGTLGGWDFTNTWAPGGGGAYPVPYTLDAVVFARPNPVSVQYGQTGPTSLTGSVSGGPQHFAFGPQGDTLDTAPLFGSVTLTGTPVGTQPLSLGTPVLTSDQGQAYRSVALSTTATVTPAPLTITAQDLTKPYGTAIAPSDTEFTAGQLFFSDRVDSVTLTSAGYAANAQVPGSPYQITPSSAQGLGLSNYAITYLPGDLTVTPAPLSVTANDRTKPYGTALSLGSSAFSVSGLLLGDTVGSVTLTSAGAAAPATVSGGPYAITPSAAQGTGLGNYAIAYLPGELVVAPAPLTVTAQDQSKVYGTLAALDPTAVNVSGLLLSDTVDRVTLTGPGTAATATVAGGPYDLTPSAAQGLGLGNYTIVYLPGDLTVTPAALSVTANNRTKTYGSALALGDTGFSVSGLVNTDTVDRVTLTSAGAAAPATVSGGPYAITPSAAQGTGLGNYAIAYLPGSLSVAPAPLSITADDRTKAYGTALALGDSAFATSGLLLGDTVARVSLSSVGAGATATVAGGPYAITPSGAQGTGLGNYAIAYLPGDLTVNPASLSITADNFSKTYGTTLTLTSNVTVAGLLNADSVDSVTVSSPGAVATATVAGGPYDVTPSAAQGTGLDNYVIAYLPGTVSVAPAPLTVTANDRTKTYGSALTLGTSAFTVAGLANADTVDRVALTSLGTDATATVLGGPYAITPSGAVGTGLGNYAIAYLPGTLTVAPAPLTITADDRTKPYGTALALGDSAFATNGLLFADRVDSLALTSAGADATATVAGGPYAVDASAATGSGLGNYAVTYLPGTLTVTPLVRVVTADDQIKGYGRQLGFAGTEYTLNTPLLFGDTALFDITSPGADATATVAGGPYAITAATAPGGANDNYSFTFLPGSLTVVPAPLSITANDRSKTYGAALPLGTSAVTVAGLANADRVDAVTLTSAGAMAQAGVAGGPYAIDASGATGSGLDNYVIAYLPGTLSVAPAPLTITANDQSKTYGTALVLGTRAVSVQGLLLGDSVDGVVLDSTGAAPTATVVGGPYAITASSAQGLGLGNYAIAYLPGTLAVAPAPLTVAARSLTKPKGATLNFAGTEFEVRGLVQPGDSITRVNLQSPGADLSAKDGTYVIQPGSAQGFGLSNYVISYAAGELVVGSGFFRPPLNKFKAPPNPRDRIGGGDSANWRDGGESSNRSRSTRETLGLFRRFNTLLDARLKNCSALADSDINAYLSCLSEALAQFAASLDEIATDLPPGLENVARIIDTARTQVDNARTRAETRLQSATSDTERAAIRLDAIAEARGAVQTAAVEIRKAIALVRVEDPELADLQRTQILNTATALEAADIELSRVVGL